MKMKRLEAGIELFFHRRAIGIGNHILKLAESGKKLILTTYPSGLLAVMVWDENKWIDLPASDWNYFIRYTENTSLQYLIVDNAD